MTMRERVMTLARTGRISPDPWLKLAWDAAEPWDYDVPVGERSERFPRAALMESMEYVTFYLPAGPAGTRARGV